MIQNLLIPTVTTQSPNGGERLLDIFSKLVDDRIILISGPIDTTTAASTIAQLLYLDSKDSSAPIQIYINSPGGSVSDGLAIYDTMQHIKSETSTICMGIAASMAAILLSGGTKGKRYILKNGEVMIHQPLGGTGANTQASDIQICAQHILKTKQKLNSLLSENCGKSIEEITFATDRDYFMSSEEAIAFGIVDKII